MESRLARIFHTFTFRLALVYVGLFSLSVIILFAFIYTFAMNYLQTQISDAIRAHYDELMGEYRENGSYGIETRIKEFVAKDSSGAEIYLLINRENEKLAGNLNEWPENAVHDSAFGKEGSWIRFHIEDLHGAEKGIEVLAISMPVSKWRSLLVGQSLQSNEHIEKTIVRTFWASLVLTLFMAFFGAIVMTRSVMGRLGVLNRSAHTIMHGHLFERFPYTQGGDEFDELSLNLNSMLDTIENLLRSLAQFANNIAHDLRSPLTRIINRLDAGLRSLHRDDPTYSLLEKNIHDLEDLVGTFNSILKISELEAISEFREFVPCDLPRIIGNLVEFYEPYAAEKNIALVNSIAVPLVIQGEKNLLTQAFANLLDNAIKFTPQGGRVTVDCEIHNTHADIVIADSGPGVPAEFRSKVFEKFFRLEQSRNTKGNGLGLSLVAAIARIHDISITLENNAPGLRVRLSIPLPAT